MEKGEIKRGVWGVTTQVVVRRLYIIYGCNTGQQSLHVVQSSSSIYARGAFVRITFLWGGKQIYHFD